MEKLNTLDSFTKSFKIKRNGEIIELTQKEMAEFRMLDDTLEGNNMINYYINECLDYDKEGECKILNEMANDERVCYKVYNEYLSELFDNTGELEMNIVEKFLKQEMSKESGVKNND